MQMPVLQNFRVTAKIPGRLKLFLVILLLRYNMYLLKNSAKKLWDTSIRQVICQKEGVLCPASETGPGPGNS